MRYGLSEETQAYNGRAHKLHTEKPEVLIQAYLAGKSEVEHNVISFYFLNIIHSVK